MATIGGIIQSRTGSSRLPGKVLKTIGSRTMLEWVVDRCRKADSLDKVIVATSNRSADDPIEDLCQSKGIDTFRGSEEDVLDRYYQTTRTCDVDTVVRLTADCPLHDPDVIDRVVRVFSDNPNYDYVGTGFEYPEGFGTEVFSARTLEQTWQEAADAREREHVTIYIWKDGSPFTVHRINPDRDYSHFRVTVDRPIDLKVVRQIVSELDLERREFGFQDIIDYLRNNPEVASLNDHIDYQEDL